MAASKIKAAGQWHDTANAFVKVDGVWRTVTASYVKTPGGWGQGTIGQPPAAPVMKHTATGKFTIQNYDATLAYTTVRVAGGGTASRSGAVVTLSDVNARFSITAGYAASSPQSGLGYFERKAYTYTDGGQSCSPNCRPISGNCFNGTGSCQGDGSCGADGTICCGGSMGSTCTDNPDIKDNYGPQGYVDQFGEWAKTV
jgi:hypothetical protein